MAESNFELPASAKIALKSINKKYGDNTATMLGDSPKLGMFKRAWSTGSLDLDLSIGAIVRNDDGTVDIGLPSGRVVEIYGEESCGKTTLCNLIIARAQERGAICAFIDMEQSWNRDYALALGVRTDELTFVQPDHGDAAADVMETLLRTGVYDIIVVDSAAAMVPKEEFEAEVSKQFMGLQPRLIGKCLKTAVPLGRAADCMVIFTNQMRVNIGQMYGNPATTPGGKQMKHAGFVRLHLRKSEEFKDSDSVIGHEVVATPAKNKAACPKRKAFFRIMYKEGGIDQPFDITKVAISSGVIRRSGSWYFHGEDKIGQGENTVVDWLRSDNVALNSIRNEVIEKVLGNAKETEVEANVEQAEQVDEPSV